MSGLTWLHDLPIRRPRIVVGLRLYSRASTDVGSVDSKISTTFSSVSFALLNHRLPMVLKRGKDVVKDNHKKQPKRYEAQGEFGF